MPRFMDPTTDFGFKKLFGEEANKDIIISFITDVLELKTQLLDIELVFMISFAKMWRAIGLLSKCRKVDWLM